MAFGIARLPDWRLARGMTGIMRGCGCVLGLGVWAAAADPVADTRVYELRTYHAAAGKRDALLERFRNHADGLFKKHGMTPVGYWVPVDSGDPTLVYLLAFADAAAREASWKSFVADEQWKQVVAASEAKGRLVRRADSLLLKATDFSPGFTPGAGVHVYELRTYTTPPGRLADLHRRFRDHTLGLFAKHGMTSLGYFQVLPGQPGDDVTLVYFLAHRNAAAAAQSWAAFRADPQWLAAKSASESAAGGSLTVADGVKSLMLQATPFSALR